MSVYFKYPVLLFILIITAPLYSQEKTNPRKTSSKGVELGQQKKYDEALLEFEKSLKSYNADSAKVYHNKGWVLELKGDDQAAIAAYEEAVKRNPVQVPSLERVGYLYFKTGRYEEAVQTGEHVISLDPKNKEVMKWLPEAYRMKLQKQQEKPAVKKNENKKQEEKIADKKEEKKPPRIVYATLDFMIRTAYYFRDSEEKKGYTYKTTSGLYANVPEMLHVNVTPNKLLEIDLEAGNPYLGALSPNLVVHTEKLEAIAHLGKYSLGLGGLGNHYRSSFAYVYLDQKNRTRHDYKAGLIFGFKEEDVSLLFRLYPRALPHDGSSSTGKTFDTDYAGFDYKYYLDKLLTFYSWMSVKDYYFFDHDVEISNYWGVYELGFGVLLGKYKNFVKWLDYISISLDLTERFYMMDLNNDEPYKFANGQGWFGANGDKWFKGDPFSGYRAAGHVLTLKVEEGIIKHLFVYQAVMAEMVNRREDHNEFNFILGIGGEY